MSIASEFLGTDVPTTASQREAGGFSFQTRARLMLTSIRRSLAWLCASVGGSWALLGGVGQLVASRTRSSAFRTQSRMIEASPTARGLDWARHPAGMRHCSPAAIAGAQREDRTAAAAGREGLTPVGHQMAKTACLSSLIWAAWTNVTRPAVGASVHVGADRLAAK
jgi:hypothetical protein